MALWWCLRITDIARTITEAQTCQARQADVFVEKNLFQGVDERVRSNLRVRHLEAQADT